MNNFIVIDIVIMSSSKSAKKALVKLKVNIFDFKSKYWPLSTVLLIKLYYDWLY